MPKQEEEEEDFTDGEDEGIEIEDDFEEDKIETTEKIKSKKSTPKVKVDDGNWEYVAQQQFSGYRNKTTGEVITTEEAIRKILDYAEEAAKNTR